MYFDSNGGTLVGSSTKSVRYNNRYGSLPTAEKSGYLFEGWFLGNIEIGSNTLMTQTSNHTLRAKYRIKTNEIEYTYRDSLQSYRIQQDGYYKFEAYGAQGGSYLSFSGGKGGYTQAVFRLKVGDTVYINIGGSGVNGGYNGGGKAIDISSVLKGYTSGGGATSIFLNGTDKEDLLMISGGGAGASPGGNGEGGGTSVATTSTYLQGENGQIGGGGGYYGGKAGTINVHHHTNKDGACWSACGNEPIQYVTPNVQVYGTPSGYRRINANKFVCIRCGGIVTPPFGINSKSDLERWDDRVNNHAGKYLTCGHEEGEVISYTAGGARTSYINPDAYYTNDEQGVKDGNGNVVITPLYELVLDLNAPVKGINANVTATNTPTITPKSEVYKSESAEFLPLALTPVNGTYSILVADNKPFNSIEGFEEMPQAQLKGWEFEGWHWEKDYANTTNTNKVHTCNKKIRHTDTFTAKGHVTKLLGNRIYAHYKENVYYIKYVGNDTINNIYNDVCTQNAVLNSNINKIGTQEYTKYNSSNCYTQKCLYDHDVQMLQNLFTKTGYFFDGWNSKVSIDNLDGTNTKKSGTGKGNGIKYIECEILKPIKNGETFQSGKCNFDYITNPREHEFEELTNIWSYTQSKVSNGSDTVIMFATWEPIRYQLRYNGNDNWNSSQPSYLQVVKDHNNKDTTFIRFDQTFNIMDSKFNRNLPHTININGEEVALKAGYKQSGWGFGKNDMVYDDTITWNLLRMNINPDARQGLLESNYANSKKNVKNVLSTESIKRINQYNLDWIASRTEIGPNKLSDKTSYHNKSFEQNLHTIWRRLREDSGDDPTPPPKPEDPYDDSFNIELTFDLNGGWYADAITNEIHEDKIVLKQEVFNVYTYTFNILGAENKDLLNKVAKLDAYGSYSLDSYDKNFEHANGLNYTLIRIDDDGTEYRFLGWSINKDAVIPDKNIIVQGNIINTDVYDGTHSNTITIANNLTLYAVWEPILKASLQMNRVLGDKTFKDGSKPITTADRLTAVTSNPTLQLIIKSGEQGRYKSITRGKDSIQFDIEFDTRITDIYDYGNETSLWYDNLNLVDNENKKELKSEDQKHSLNRHINKSLGLVDRKFYIPQYLSTDRTYSSSVGVNKFNVNFTLTQESYFWSCVYNKKEEIKVPAEIYILKDDNTPPNPGPDPGPDPGPVEPLPGDPPEQDNAVRELKTTILN